MSEWEIVRHQVAIAGRVTEVTEAQTDRQTDQETGRAIADAQVEIKDAPAAFKAWLAMRAIQYGDRWEAMPERPDRTRTAADGHFHFLDLPAGQYTLVASLPGAGTRYGQSKAMTVTVSQDKDGKYTYTPEPAELNLPPTTVKGRITTQEKGQNEEDQVEKPVAMAEVRVVGSGEHTYSDTQGDYCLTGLEVNKENGIPKKRILELKVSARGYLDDKKPVELNQPGQVQSADFKLSRKSSTMVAV